MDTHTGAERKYGPLTEFLLRQSGEILPMSFDEVERVIGERLPPSATRHRAFWSNNPSNSVMTQAWLDAGFRSEQVDMKRRRLMFRRTHQAPTSGRPRTSDDALPHPLVGWMKGTMTIAPGVDLTAPADPDWAAPVPPATDGTTDE